MLVARVCDGTPVPGTGHGGVVPLTELRLTRPWTCAGRQRKALPGRRRGRPAGRPASRAPGRFVPDGPPRGRFRENRRGGQPLRPQPSAATGCSVTSATYASALERRLSRS